MYFPLYAAYRTSTMKFIKVAINVIITFAVYVVCTEEIEKLAKKLELLKIEREELGSAFANEGLKDRHTKNRTKLIIMFLQLERLENDIYSLEDHMLDVEDLEKVALADPAYSSIREKIHDERRLTYKFRTTFFHASLNETRIEALFYYNDQVIKHQGEEWLLEKQLYMAESRLRFHKKEEQKKRDEQQQQIYLLESRLRFHDKEMETKRKKVAV